MSSKKYLFLITLGMKDSAVNLLLSIFLAMLTKQEAPL